MIDNKFYSFPDIGQFRNVIQNVSNRTRFIGKDENYKPILCTVLLGMPYRYKRLMIKRFFFLSFAHA